MLNAHIFAFAVVPPVAPLHCVVTAEDVSKPAAILNFNGVRYVTCCLNCAGKFKNDPQAVVKASKSNGALIGESLFDPTTGARIDGKKAVASSDFEGVRFYFASAEGKKSFDAEPKKWSARPEKELVFCPIMGHALKSVSEAGGYVDVKNVRYYVCCGDCLAEAKKSTASIATKFESKAAKSAVVEEPAKTDGK